MPLAYLEPLRKMLLRYERMWDGRISEINIVKNRIDLAPEARPHIKRPFRAASASRKFVSDEVQTMLEQGIIETAQSEWDLPVVVAPKADGSLRFCVDYRT